MKSKFLAVICVCGLFSGSSLNSYAAWSIVDPLPSDDYETSSDIAAAGACDQTHGTAFTLKLIQGGVTKQSVSGTANIGPEEEIEDWSGTLETPTGEWNEGPATVRLTYNPGNYPLKADVSIDIVGFE